MNNSQQQFTHHVIFAACLAIAVSGCSLADSDDLADRDSVNQSDENEVLSARAVPCLTEDEWGGCGSYCTGGELSAEQASSCMEVCDAYPRCEDAQRSESNREEKHSSFLFPCMDDDEWGACGSYCYGGSLDIYQANLCMDFCDAMRC